MDSKRIFRLFSGCIATLAISAGLAGAEEASKKELIQRAMSAAPPSVGADATIVTVDGTVLREGSNGWTCMPNMGPGADFPLCNDAVWMRFMEALMAKEEFQTDVMGISYMLQGDAKVNNADPFDTEPNEGEVWVQEGPHLMIIAPDDAMLANLPSDPESGGPYVMWKGTPYAHIMVPVAAGEGQ